MRSLRLLPRNGFSLKLAAIALAGAVAASMLVATLIVVALTGADGSVSIAGLDAGAVRGEIVGGWLFLFFGAL